jgi:hypothetical protein
VSTNSTLFQPNHELPHPVPQVHPQYGHPLDVVVTVLLLVLV